METTVYQSNISIFRKSFDLLISGILNNNNNSSSSSNNNNNNNNNNEGWEITSDEE